jgi:hypothetical protein
MKDSSIREEIAIRPIKSTGPEKLITCAGKSARSETREKSGTGEAV